MVDPALIDEKITVEWNTVVEEILCRDGVVAGVRVRDATPAQSGFWTSPDCSSPSATTRAANCSAAKST